NHGTRYPGLLPESGTEQQIRRHDGRGLLESQHGRGGFHGRHLQELDSAPQENPHRLFSAGDRAVLDSPPRFLRVLLRPSVLRRGRGRSRASRQERLEFSQRRATRLLGFSLLRLHDRHVLSDFGLTVSSRSMRRITLFHAVISFLYVTAILGLLINILSNEI